MNRRKFVKNLGQAAIAMSSTRTVLNQLHNFLESGEMLPAFFIGHGNPMNAIENNEFSLEWDLLGKKLPKPKAILCISAHWETQGTKVTALQSPPTIHDFMGFPKELFAKQYPAPGAPEYARMTAEQVHKTHIELDHEWGLDHGTWSVLCRIFPLADVPTFQLSLDYNKPPQYHYELAGELKALRKKGVLIIGSGNMVHNLRMMQFKDIAFDWANEFDEKLRHLILQNDHQAIINYKSFGRMAELSIPTNEHFLPMIYALGVQDKNEQPVFFNDKVIMGSISMRSFSVG
jgi:4,5-DOPA dioxygenase extradiol